MCSIITATGREKVLKTNEERKKNCVIRLPVSSSYICKTYIDIYTVWGCSQLDN